MLFRAALPVVSTASVNQPGNLVIGYRLLFLVSNKRLSEQVCPTNPGGALELADDLCASTSHQAALHICVQILVPESALAIGHPGVTPAHVQGGNTGLFRATDAGGALTLNSVMAAGATVNVTFTRAVGNGGRIAYGYTNLYNDAWVKDAADASPVPLFDAVVLTP